MGGGGTQHLVRDLLFSPGSKVPRFQRFQGSKVPKFQGSKVPAEGSAEVRKCGSAEVRKCGNGDLLLPG